MGLFASNEYEEFKEARKEFTEENKSMRFAIHKKTKDPKNIPFDNVHTTIYESVGLGQEWRVDKALNAQELNQATGGFREVTEHFEENYMDREVHSSSILQKIVNLFKRK